MTTTCPPGGDLERLLADLLSGEEEQALEAHVCNCAACQRRLDELTRGQLTLPALPSQPETSSPDKPSDHASGSPDQPVAGYQLLGGIGRGGMGIVYRAHDPAVNRHVAVKVLQDRFRASPMATRRFVEEGQVTGQLQHPAIPAIHQIGTLSDGSPYLVMKLIKGDTLAEHLAAPNSDRARLVAAFLQVAQAIGYAHSKGVIHRDLKPQNVMIGQFGEVQVMDWGLAKVLSEARHESAPEPTGVATLHSVIETARSSDHGAFTQAGSVLGTPAYMSPEQAGGEIHKLDQRADVFGLGAVLCEILTGVPPYRDKTVEALRLRGVRGQLDDVLARLDGCGADPELIELCKRCLGPDRDARPRDAGEVAAVAAHLAAVEDRLRRAERDRAAAEARAAEQRKRRRVQRALAAAGVLILALVGAGAWWADRQAGEREKDRAVEAERNRQEAVAFLTQAEEAVGSGNLATAETALTQAGSRLGTDGPDDLWARLAGTKRDRDIVRELRDIDDLSWVPSEKGRQGRADATGRYREAFARYGLDVGGENPGEAAAAVRASRVSAALVAGLGEWFTTDPDRRNLRPLLDRLDPDPDRMAVRAVIAAGDEGRARSLVAGLDGSKVPVWFAASVGFHAMVPPKDGVRLMTAAWRANPGYYPLAFRLAHQRISYPKQFEGDRAGEAIAWARMAVALRPDHPIPHNLLGLAWKRAGDLDEAEASFRRAIELTPKYPFFVAAHVNLANVLADRGDRAGAESSYRAALAIVPNYFVANWNLGVLLEKQGDLAGAEGCYRKAIEAEPNNPRYRVGLDGVVRRRALLTRLEEVAAGRAEPANPAEATELALLCSDRTRRRYVLAVRLYLRAFAADPALFEITNSHRYRPACSAALAAAGKDAEAATFGVEEWGYLTGLALRWLRADLTLLTARSKEPKQRPEVRKLLARWKSDQDLLSVRDAVWLAAMPPADRARWESLWADVDALLAAMPLEVAPPQPGRW